MPRLSKPLVGVNLRQRLGNESDGSVRLPRQLTGRLGESLEISPSAPVVPVTSTEFLTS
jgi:hypothetical protein